MSDSEFVTQPSPQPSPLTTPPKSPLSSQESSYLAELTTLSTPTSSQQFSWRVTSPDLFGPSPTRTSSQGSTPSSSQEDPNDFFPWNHPLHKSNLTQRSPSPQRLKNNPQ